MGMIRYGTCTWSEKSWVGVFYPPRTQPVDFLAHYAEHFDTVEADSSYYALPARRVVEGWERKTPPGFVLSAKFPREIVHGGASEKPEAAKVLVESAVGALRDTFVERMALLGPKLGPLVLQFPYFNRQTFAEPAPFYARLDAFLERMPRGPRIAVELRNRNWITEELLALLRRHRAAFVLVDLAYMPHPHELAKAHELVTADFCYARLIGDRAAIDAKTKTFDRIVVDQSERLADWAELLAGLKQRELDTFVYVNNHYAGHAPATVRDLRARVEARG